MTTLARLLRLLRSNGTMPCPQHLVAKVLGGDSLELSDACLKELESLGFVISVHPIDGWSLVAEPDIIIPDDLFSLVYRDDFPWKITVFKQTSSTNDRIYEMACCGHPEGAVVFAETQTAGRGRQLRQWQSSHGLGLWFSILLRPPTPVQSSGRITAAAALAVTEAVREKTLLPAEIKWPNDVWIGHRKLAGVLTELHAVQGNQPCVVVGIGVNVNHSEADFEGAVQNTATSIKMEAGRPFRRAVLAASILDHFAEYYSMGFEEIRSAWIDRCMTLGKHVTFVEDGRVLEGIAETLDDGGNLLVRKTNGTLSVVHSGEVFVRHSPE